VATAGGGSSARSISIKSAASPFTIAENLDLGGTDGRVELTNEQRDHVERASMPVR
jgi:hypothetical protein